MLRGCCAYGNIAKPRGTRSVSRAHHLLRLSFSAVGRAPQRPVIAIANGIAPVPKLGGNAAVAGILQHARLFAAANFPGHLAAELKIKALVVDRPAPVRLHPD